MLRRRHLALLALVPCDDIGVRQLAAKNVERAADRDVNAPLAGSSDALQVSLQRTARRTSSSQARPCVTSCCRDNTSQQL